MSAPNPITLITAIPTFASAEEHATIVGSTPASFADIPPILKHAQSNVRVVLDPPVPGFEEADAAQGTLYVLTSVLVFFSTTGRGFQVPYPSITLHAISRAGPVPAIYCQLDLGPAADANEDDEDADTELQELSIIPQDAASLDTIFETLSVCASLHPDPNSPDDDDGGDDNAFIDPLSSPFETFNGTTDQELSEVGRAALAHIESIIYDPFDHDEHNGEEGAEVPPDSDEEPEDGEELEDADEGEEETKEGEETKTNPAALAAGVVKAT